MVPISGRPYPFLWKRYFVVSGSFLLVDLSLFGTEIYALCGVGLSTDGSKPSSGLYTAAETAHAQCACRLDIRSLNRAKE